jgi:hypothetical protein
LVSAPPFSPGVRPGLTSFDSLHGLTALRFCMKSRSCILLVVFEVETYLFEPNVPLHPWRLPPEPSSLSATVYSSTSSFSRPLQLSSLDHGGEAFHDGPYSGIRTVFSSVIWTSAPSILWKQ